MKTKNKYAILMIGVFLLGSVYMSLSSWALCVKELEAAYNLSSTSVMLGSAAFVAGYSIASFIGGNLMSKCGWRISFNISLIIYLIATFLIPNMDNYNIILILRFLQGFGLVVPITVALVTSWFKTDQRGLASGILATCAPAGAALGSLISSYITPVLGWQFNFYILDIIVLAVMIMFNLFMGMSPESKNNNTIETTMSAQINTNSHKSIYTHPILILEGLCLFCIFFFVYGMYSFMSNYYFSLGFSIAEVGALGFWNGFIGILSIPFGGWIGDYFIKKGVITIKARAYSMAVVSFLLAAIGALLVPVISPLSFGAALFAGLLVGWAGPASNGQILSIPSDVFGANNAGKAMGFIILIAGLGGIISPILVSYIATTFGWTLGWIVTSLSAVIGFIICLLMPHFVSQSTRSTIANPNYSNPNINISK